MNTYITAPTIKALREQKKLTQVQLADQLSVSHKTISKWETGKGLPDISLLEPLDKALDVSLPELFFGQPTTNANRSANLLRSKLKSKVFCDYFSACEDCDVLKHFLSSVAESWSFYSAAFESSAD